MQFFSLAIIRIAYMCSTCRPPEICRSSIVTFECDKKSSNEPHAITPGLGRRSFIIFFFAVYRRIEIVILLRFTNQRLSTIKQPPQQIIIIIEIVWHFHFPLVTSSRCERATKSVMRKSTTTITMTTQSTIVINVLFSSARQQQEIVPPPSYTQHTCDIYYRKSFRFTFRKSKCNYIRGLEEKK